MAQDPGQPSASDLLRRARQGEREALDQLLTRIRTRLDALTRARLGANLKARVRHSDVIQSTYLEVLKRVTRFDGEDEEAFVAWVARILENNIKRKARYFGAKKRQELPPEDAPGGTARPATPSLHAARHEDLTLVSRALEKLPESYSRVVIWRIIDELEYEEIAERMEMTVPAARTLLWRARAALTIEVEKLERGRT